MYHQREYSQGLFCLWRRASMKRAAFKQPQCWERTSWLSLAPWRLSSSKVETLSFSDCFHPCPGDCGCPWGTIASLSSTGKKTQPTSKNIVYVSMVCASVTVNQWSELWGRITAFSPRSLPWTAPSPVTGTNVFFRIYIKVSSGCRDLCYELKISFFRSDLKEQQEATRSFKLGRGAANTEVTQGCGYSHCALQRALCTSTDWDYSTKTGKTRIHPVACVVFTSFLALTGLCSKSWRSSDGDLPSRFKKKGIGFCSQQHRWAKWNITITHSQFLVKHL